MTKLAEAYDSAAEALAALAIAIRAEGAQNGTGEPVGAPSFEDLPFDERDAPAAAPLASPAPHGSAAVCPSHAIPYRSGKFGSYCPSTSDDPKWSNDKGYCQITPKSAAAWLRQKAAAG